MIKSIFLRRRLFLSGVSCPYAGNADAVKIGKVNVIYDGADNGYKSLPDAASLTVNPEASYLHITSNETIGGIQWKDWPDTSFPIICDM
jgi:phosphoserine aminotransferase